MQSQKTRAACDRSKKNDAYMHVPDYTTKPRDGSLNLHEQEPALKTYIISIKDDCI